MHRPKNGEVSVDNDLSRPLNIVYPYLRRRMEVTKLAFDKICSQGTTYQSSVYTYHSSTLLDLHSLVYPFRSNSFHF